jgi:hypothetical protein
MLPLSDLQRVKTNVIGDDGQNLSMTENIQDLD